MATSAGGSAGPSAIFQLMLIAILAFLFLVALGGFHHLVVRSFLDSAVGEALVQQRFIRGHDARNLPAAFARNGTGLAWVIRRAALRAGQLRSRLFPVRIGELVGIALVEARDLARALFDHPGRRHPKLSFAAGKVADRYL